MKLKITASLLAGFLVAGCGSDLDNELPEAQFVGLRFESVNQQVAIGGTGSYTLLAQFDTGEEIDITGELEVFSDHPELVEPDDLGGLSGLSLGTTQIRAEFDGREAVANVTTTGNRLFVTEYDDNRIQVFPADANGTPNALRVIEGAATRLDFPAHCQVVGNELFVANDATGGGRITVHSVSASGNVAPLREISGNNTQLGTLYSICVGRGEIFAANEGSGQILIFPANGNGNIAPIGVIEGANTGLTSIYAVFLSGDELFVTDNAGDGRIAVFNRTDDGNVAPKRVITGVNTSMSDPTGIFVQGSEIYVGDETSDSVAVFSLNDTGNIGPLRLIQGANTLLQFPDQLIRLGGEILVAEYTGDRVLGFPVSTDGNVAPTRVLNSNTTTFDGPSGISIGNDN